MEGSPSSACDVSFPSDRFTLGWHGCDEIGRRRAFERQSVPNVSHDALLQRLHEMHARVAARHFMAIYHHSRRSALSALRVGIVPALFPPRYRQPAPNLATALATVGNGR